VENENQAVLFMARELQYNLQEKLPFVICGSDFK